MKKKLLVAVMVLLALCLSCAAVAEQKPALLSLEIEVTAEGKLPKTPDDFTVRITANDAQNPMPAGQTGGSYDVTVKGPGKVVFPAMTFAHVGTYTYTVRQIAGGNQNCEYDSAVYTLTVTVVNNADFTGLETVAVFTDAQGGPKADNNLFNNVYTADPANGNVTPTGVVDRWPYFMAGCVVLLCAGCVLATKLRRREEDEGAVLAEDDADV